MSYGHTARRAARNHIIADVNVGLPGMSDVRSEFLALADLASPWHTVTCSCGDSFGDERLSRAFAAHGEHQANAAWSAVHDTLVTTHRLLARQARAKATESLRQARAAAAGAARKRVSA